MPVLIPNTLPGLRPGDGALASAGIGILRPPDEGWPQVFIRLGEGALGTGYAAVPQSTVA
ncbi:hypothetical protein LHP98_06895 [Rhodobacter sp. Har01]|uniref:hypothetical protein n=1 Tax=Rhodobacter sp. Har01 TaxID=2883999 RepID=UPI001D0720EA|nr:hypothetical protein [Rhodobacter sp. Har01]MCB6177858.1 hypothetical protein [Rhodobacter sp. Har01]